LIAEPDNFFPKIVIASKPLQCLNRRRPVMEEKSDIQADLVPRTRVDLLERFRISAACRDIVNNTSLFGTFMDASVLFRSAIDYGRSHDPGAARYLYSRLVDEFGPEKVERAFPGRSSGEQEARRPIPVTAAVWGAFDLADQLRATTAGPDHYIGVHHVLFALATYEPSTRELRVLLRSALGIDDAKWVARQLIPFLQHNLEEGESWDAWEGIVQPLGLSSAEPPSPEPPPAAASTPAQPEPPPPSSEPVPMLPDDPANVDELGRRPFAEVLAQRIEQIRQHDPHSTFMIHIDGPWGSGKTSILNFLHGHFCKEKPPPHRWVLIDFNAWRNQRVRPPWWSLLREIYLQARTQLDFRGSLRLRRRWWLWNIRADWLPMAVTFVFFTFAVLLTFRVDTKGSAASSNSLFDPLKLLTWIFAAWAAVYTFTRSLLFGSSKAAQTYVEIRSDPLQPIVKLFHRLITAVRRPVIVVIDDLDRCTAEYIVEFMEGIQTLLRSTPIVYVVAADRKWICASFEKIYTDFRSAIGEAGRPLGYLFLDKVFQVSARIPQITTRSKRQYWDMLLHTNHSRDPSNLDRQLKQAEAEELNAFKGVNNAEELQARIDSVKGDPLRQQAMRAAAAKQITTPGAERATEHRLRPFSDMLERNPRSMKRFINAYGLHQATLFLEGRFVAPEVLARWIILELRWPLLADFLSEQPDAVAQQPANSDRSTGVPKHLRKLLGDAKVQAVLHGKPELPPLDPAAIRTINGSDQ
jgi:KAP family P-loop domain